LEGDEAMRPGFLGVAGRELSFIWRDRIAFLIVLVLPLMASALLASTFSDPVIRRLRVAVVDQDRTQTSLAYAQAVDASPGVEVADRFDDLSSAMHAVRSGRDIAVVFLPERLEHDALSGKRPQIVVFYNEQFYTAGNLASSSLRSALSAVTARLAAGGGGFRPGRLVVERYALVNPQTNYAQFLLRSLLPTVLHALIAISGSYSVGSEFRYRSLSQWLQAAAGRPATALAGKFAPYVALFLFQFALGVAILHLVFKLQFRGDPVLTAASTVLMIVGYLSLGALFQTLTKDLASGLSLTGIVCSPAFGFAGVGFPVLGMSGFAKAWGALLPLRWYLQILFDQAARGSSSSDSASAFAWMSGLSVGYFALALWRLVALLRAPPRARPEFELPPMPSGRPAAAFAVEAIRILKTPTAFGLIVLAPVIYGALYPQPYLGQLVRKIPIAVVDRDRAQISRDIVQTLDADQSLEVAAEPATLADARRMLAERRVFGVLEIPPGAERDILKGDDAHLPAYVDSTYLMLYSKVLAGISESVANVSAALQTRGARLDGSLAHHALAAAEPVAVLSQPLFNPVGGYASYVVPAAFVLILQQTLMIAVTTLGGGSAWRLPGAAPRLRFALSAPLGRALAHVAFSAPGFALYLYVLPRFYGFTASATPLTLAVIALPFALAISFLGQCLGVLVERREAAVLVLIGVSLPLFFLVGVAWPQQQIPRVLAAAAQFVPSTTGIEALLQANQMSASLSDVAGELETLWSLAALYGAIAVSATALARRRIA
jgi:ABC-2 type transport system permease protein